jgi:hypothetical protein
MNNTDPAYDNEPFLIEYGPEDEADRYTLAELSAMKITREIWLAEMIKGGFPASFIQRQRQLCASVRLAICLKLAIHLKSTA